MGTTSILAFDKQNQNVNAEEEDKMQAATTDSKHKAARRVRRKIAYVRRTVELHPEVDEMLERMQMALKLRSHTEVIQKAVQLLAIILGEDGAGKRRVYIEQNDGKLQELLII